MQAVFKSELSSYEIEIIRKFCDSVDYCALEQSLDFPEILYNSRITYFYLIEDEVIKSFCQIFENFKSANIWFGPVCSDREIVIASINEIIAHYKKKGHYYLGIQLYLKSGYETDYIEYYLNKLHRIRYFFNNENTKSSIEIDLEGSLENIFNNIRKGHKSDIKKAQKTGLRVASLDDIAALDPFIEIYLRMCSVRGIKGHSAEEIQGICRFLINGRKGQILVARDNDGKILGGGIFVYQGISVRYLLGASDPDRREMPLLHPVIFRAIEMAKLNGFKYFDFWGYNHFADDGDQANNINHFKSGFGGYYIFFAKKMNIDLVPNGYYIYRCLQFGKNLTKKLF